MLLSGRGYLVLRPTTHEARPGSPRLTGTDQTGLEARELMAPTYGLAQIALITTKAAREEVTQSEQANARRH